MLKSLLKNALAIIGLVVLLIAYAIGYLSLYDFLNAMTVLVFLGILTLCLEDIFRKVFYHRDVITWQYAILILFIVCCDFLWLFFAACVTWLQFFGRFVLLLVASAGTLGWAIFAYRVSIMTDVERKVMRLTKIYKKVFKNVSGMTDDEVRTALEGALFCRLEGDSLEGGLCISEPFTADCATFEELANRDDGSDYTNVIDAIGDYISLVIANRKGE